MSTVANPHPAAVTTAYSAVVTPRSVRRGATGDLVMRTSWTGPPSRWAVVAVTLARIRNGHEGPFRLWGRRPDLVPCGGKPDGSSADQHGHRPRHQRHHTHQTNAGNRHTPRGTAAFTPTARAFPSTSARDRRRRSSASRCMASATEAPV